MIDGGASVNLVVITALGEKATISSWEEIELTGITTNPIHTLGTTILHIHEAPALFYVVKELAIEADGLIGSPFLKQEEAEISYYHGTLVLKNKPTRPLRFSNYQDILQTNKLPTSTKHRIEPRTSQQIAITIANPRIREGYLPRIKTLKHLYIGEAVVKNNEGKCYVMATNTSDEPLDVEIEPQTLEPFDIFSSSDEDFYPAAEHPSNFKTNEDRKQKILEALNTKHLNKEELDFVTNLVKEFPDRFYLPGGKLGKASDFKHSIYTFSDIPINTRQYSYPLIHQKEIQKQISALLSNGIISPSKSPYNSPLWIVPKNEDENGVKRW